VSHNQPRRPHYGETKPFKPMAVPKAGFDAPKAPRNRNLIGIILLSIIVISAVLVGVFLIRLKKAQSSPKPTITVTYIGLASQEPNEDTNTPVIPSDIPEPTQGQSPSRFFTATLSPVPSHTPAPSKTLAPTFTPTSVSYPFIIRNNTQLAHTMYFPYEKCETSVYVGGQVLDYTEKDVLGYVVRLTGVHAGKPIDLSSETGSMSVFGPSGFGFVLPNDVRSGDEIIIQLFDAQGNALSRESIIDLSGDCDINLTLIRYKQSGDL